MNACFKAAFLKLYYKDSEGLLKMEKKEKGKNKKGWLSRLMEKIVKAQKESLKSGCRT